MTRPKFSQELRLQVWNKTHGKCLHCKLILPDEWDIDHYPVVYRDIEDQCYCWPCGSITNPLSLDNLQPSCKSCNRSGKYEKSKRSFFLGEEKEWKGYQLEWKNQLKIFNIDPIVTPNFRLFQ